MADLDLSPHGINVARVLRNPAPARLYEDAVIREQAVITSTGALLASSGIKTGRSPKDKRIVDNPASSADVWWGNINIKSDEPAFMANRQRGHRLPQHPQTDLRRRRLCRLGPQVPVEDPRDLRPGLPCTVHAQHADPPHARGVGRSSASRTT